MPGPESLTSIIPGVALIRRVRAAPLPSMAAQAFKTRLVKARVSASVFAAIRGSAAGISRLRSMPLGRRSCAANRRRKTAGLTAPRAISSPLAVSQQARGQGRTAVDRSLDACRVGQREMIHNKSKLIIDIVRNACRGRIRLSRAWMSSRLKHRIARDRLRPDLPVR